MFHVRFSARALRASFLAALVAVSFAHAARAAEPPPPALDPAVADGAAAFTRLLAAETEKLSIALNGIAGDPELVRLFLARDRAKLLAAAKPRFKRLNERIGVTHLYFLEPPPARTCFLRVHAPDLTGDVIQRVTFTRAIETGGLGAGMELGRTAFALRAVKPVQDGGKVVGYVELGEEIDGLLSSMKELSGDDYGIFADKGKVDRKELAKIRREDRWDEHPGVVLIESTVWNAQQVRVDMPLATVPTGGRGLGSWTDGGHSYVGGVFPIQDAAGSVAGLLYVRHLVKR
jgi:hypothetical protein